MSCVLRPLRGRYDEGELNGGKHGGDPKAQFSLAHGILHQGPAGIRPHRGARLIRQP